MLRTRPARNEEYGRVRRPGKKGNGKKKEPEPNITKARMQVRVVALAMVVAVVFAILGFRLWYLQALTGEDYNAWAQATHTREVKIPAQRGVIYDRDGEVLANNVPGLNVTVVPNAIEREKVAELAEILEADKEEVLGRYDAALESGNQYSPMLVKENAEREDVMYVSERTERFTGLVVNDDYVRNYPEGDLASHVLGYTGAINETELSAGGIFEGLQNDAVVGKSGAELAYEEILRGEPGKKEYNVDALGREVEVRMADGTRYDGRPEDVPEYGEPARIVDPEPGQDLKLTVDMDLQKVVEQELDDAIRRTQEDGYEGSGGAVVAMDPRNGEIVAMASRPSFDPQLFVGGVTGAEEIEQFRYLSSENASAPFANRAIYGSYPPASTFKVFTGMAGLQQGAISPNTTVTDTGECWRPAGSIGGCWQSWRENSPEYGILGPHGTQNYAEALMDSNDKFFYQVADWIWNRVGDENWLPKFYERFGFGALTGVDLPGESAGRVPTREWQEEVGATPDDKLWTVGRWVNMSIGQGDLLVTPVQLVRGYAAIQNGGTLVTPHVGLEVRDQNGEVVEKISPEPAGKVDVDPRYLENTIEGLRKVTGEGGTAESIFQGAKLPFVGKSGTGEVWGKDWMNWFVGWVENQERPLVVLVMVEGGGAFEQGSEKTAGPAARHILEAYYGVEQSPEDPTRTEGPDEAEEESAPTEGPTANPEDGPTPVAPQPPVPASNPAAVPAGGTDYYTDPSYYVDPGYYPPAAY